ncbi:uncharacterized protein LOC144452994 [Glandiceps talaboti]
MEQSTQSQKFGHSNVEISPVTDSRSTSSMQTMLLPTNRARRRVRTTGATLSRNLQRPPHKEKEPHLVARRNARERRRVQMVNDGFLRLRRHVPTDPRNKKLSKVKTLRSAINYILHLQQLLEDGDENTCKQPTDRESSLSNHSENQNSDLEWMSFGVNMENGMECNTSQDTYTY